jgi:phosphotriesterase-related protein
VVSLEPLDSRTAAEARWNPGGFPDNYRLTDVAEVATELKRFVAMGGQTVVDTTSIGLGRNPSALVKIAEETGLAVVMGGGYYLAGTHPPGLADESEDAIAGQLVDEFQNGVNGSGIRPGIIGELGTSDPVHPAEEKVLRAAVRAHLSTGLALSIHLHPWGKEGLKVLGILAEEGMDPEKVILNHLTTAVDDDDYQRALLERGVYLAYDLFGFDHSLLGLGRYAPSDAVVAAKVVELANHGHVDRLLISQDVGVKTRLLTYGGWGYAHLLTHVVPLLKSLGLGDLSIERLLVENPQRVLALPAEAREEVS